MYTAQCIWEKDARVIGLLYVSFGRVRSTEVCFSCPARKASKICRSVRVTAQLCVIVSENLGLAASVLPDEQKGHH